MKNAPNGATSYKMEKRIAVNMQTYQGEGYLCPSFF